MLGGWHDAKKSDIEREVKNVFHRHQASALLRDIHIPVVRARFCRVELIYPEGGLGAKRALQSTVIATMKKDLGNSTIPEQEGNRLWITRNRSPAEPKSEHGDYAVAKVGALALDAGPSRTGKV